MISNQIRFRHFELDQVVRTRATESALDFNPLIGWRSRRLKTSTTRGTMRSHFLDIDRRCYDFDVVERELRALSNNHSIDGDEGTPVVIESIAVAPLLIRIEINPTELRDRSYVSASNYSRGER